VHPVTIVTPNGTQVTKTIGECVKEQHTATQKVVEDVEVVKKAVDEKEEGSLAQVVVTVKNGFHEDRAERLADRAADKVRDRTRSRERWKYVKEKALNNLKSKKPARDGLEQYL
jgi:precorrin isomerase